MELDFGDFALRERIYASGVRQPRHTHEHSNITVVTGGELFEAAGGGAHHATAFSVVVKRGGCEHEDRVSGFGARTLSIEFASHRPIAQTFPVWAWFETPAVVRAALSLHRAWMHGDSVVTAASANALIALATRPQRPSTTAPWLDALLAAIERRVDEPIRFDELARELGLHPVYLARAFRRHMSMSMTDHVRALRIRRARHLLASTRHSTTAIAAECGFSDASHLCRTFSRLLGTTPETYRKQATGRGSVRSMRGRGRPLHCGA